MVSLTMMARLLEAVRPDARLVLVGDPDQLASVEAGAVLADLVDGLRAARRRRRWPRCAPSHRFGERDRRAGRRRCATATPTRCSTLLRAGGERGRAGRPRRRRRDGRRPRAVAARPRSPCARAAEAGDADAARSTALDRHRLLCAHREGPYGVADWNRAGRALAGRGAPGSPATSEWYVGRPLLVTANDYGLGVYNGDIGVVVRRPTAGCASSSPAPAGCRDFATGRLGRRARPCTR